MKPLIHILNLQKLASQNNLNQLKVQAMGEANAYGVHPGAINALFQEPSSSSGTSSGVPTVGGTFQGSKVLRVRQIK